MASALTYTASGITFAKATDFNMRVAMTEDGIKPLESVITPVTFATGKISVSISSQTVSGTDTVFTVDFTVGDYLFYYNSTGDPVLVGKISTISNDTTLTLVTAFPGSSISGRNCGKMNVVAGGMDSFIVSIPTQINTQTKSCIIPNWSAYVTSFKVTPSSIGDINPTLLNLQQYSNVNNPQVAANPAVNIQSTLLPIKAEWRITNQKLWQSTEAFPAFCFALINPYGDTTTGLASNTLFRMFVNQSFSLNGVSVSVQEDPNNLSKFGYSY